MSIKLMSKDDVSEEFVKACEAAGIPLAKRQWKKWNRRVGKAWRTHVAGKDG